MERVIDVDGIIKRLSRPRVDRLGNVNDKVRGINGSRTDISMFTKMHLVTDCFKWKGSPTITVHYKVKDYSFRYNRDMLIKIERVEVRE